MGKKKNAKLDWDTVISLVDRSFTILKDESDYQVFLSGLRSDYCPPETIPQRLEEFKSLRNTKGNNILTFFAFHDEPDSPSNDHWGKFTLYKCVAVREENGETGIFQRNIGTFPH